MGPAVGSAGVVARPHAHVAPKYSVNSQPSAALGVARTLRVGAVAHMSRYARAAAEAVGGIGLRRRRIGDTDDCLKILHAALHRSSPRSMRPETPLNAATMRLVLRYVGIDALSKASSFHDNTRVSSHVHPPDSHQLSIPTLHAPPTKNGQ